MYVSNYLDDFLTNSAFRSSEKDAKILLLRFSWFIEPLWPLTINGSAVKLHQQPYEFSIVVVKQKFKIYLFFSLFYSHWPLTAGQLRCIRLPYEFSFSFVVVK